MSLLQHASSDTACEKHRAGSSAWQPLPCVNVPDIVGSCGAGGMVEIFLFIIAAGVIAHLIGASVHEGIFVGALVRADPSQPSLDRRLEMSYAQCSWIDDAAYQCCCLLCNSAGLH